MIYQQWLVNFGNKKTTIAVVQLPPEDKLMTVESVEGDTVQCAWMDPSRTVVYHELPVGMLIFPAAESFSKRPGKLSDENLTHDIADLQDNPHQKIYRPPVAI